MKNNNEKKEEIKNAISSSEEQNIEVKTSKKSVIIALLIIIVIIGAIIGTYVIKNNNSKENTLTNNNKESENQSNERDSTLKQVKVTNDFIKIREQANVESKVIGKVYENEIYTIINEFEKSSYGWLEIETSNGIRGFIASKNDNTAYVERLEVVNNEETSTPKEKLHNYLINEGFTTNDNIIYEEYLSNSSSKLLKTINLNKNLYEYYSDAYSTEILIEYNYKKNNAKYTIKLSDYGYYKSLELNLNNGKWTCNSSLNGSLCDSVDEQIDAIYEKINEFKDILNNANISIEEIIK